MLEDGIEDTKNWLPNKALQPMNRARNVAAGKHCFFRSQLCVDLRLPIAAKLETKPYRTGEYKGLCHARLFHKLFK